jgi:hypothetical protein
LTLVYQKQGKRGDTLAWPRAAPAAVLAHAVAEGTGAQQRGDAKGLIEHRAGYFLNHITILRAAAWESASPSFDPARMANATSPLGWAAYAIGSLLHGKWCGDCVNHPLAMTRR